MLTILVNQVNLGRNLFRVNNFLVNHFAFNAPTVRMTSVYTHQTPANLCHAVNTPTNTKLGKVVRFPRKKRDRSTKQIAPYSRHREVEQLSAQRHEDVSVRQLAS